MATYNITITNNGSSNYIFNGSHAGGVLSGSNDPSLTFDAGDVVNFTFNQMSTHQFQIRQGSSTGTIVFGSYASGTQTWNASAGSYTYVCQNHSSMQGSISVAGGATTTTTQTTTTQAATSTTQTTTTQAATSTTQTTTTQADTTTTQAPTTQAPSPQVPVTTQPPDSATPVYTAPSNVITNDGDTWTLPSKVLVFGAAREEIMNLRRTFQFNFHKDSIVYDVKIKKGYSTYGYRDVFFIRNITTPTLNLYRGQSYILDLRDPSNLENPIRLYTRAKQKNRKLNIGLFPYDNGVSYFGKAGEEYGLIYFTVPENAPDMLFYDSLNGLQYGGKINIKSIQVTTTEPPPAVPPLRLPPDNLYVYDTSSVVCDIQGACVPRTGKGRKSDIRYRIPDYEFLDPVTTTVAPSTTQSVSTTSSTTTTFSPDENPYDVVKYPDNAVVIPVIVGGGQNWYGAGNKYYTDKLLETVSSYVPSIKNNVFGSTGSSWKLIPRRLESFSPPSTLFSVQSEQATDVGINGLEIEAQKVEPNISETHPWIEVNPNDPSGIQLRFNYTDLKYIDFVPEDSLPDSVVPSTFSADLRPVRRAVVTRGEGNTWAVNGGRYFDITWGVGITTQVTRLKSVDTDGDGMDELVNIPTTNSYGVQLAKHCAHPCSTCNTEDKLTHDFPPDIPSEPEFIGGEQNATHPKASMTYTPYRNNTTAGVASILSVSAGSNFEVSASVGLQGDRTVLNWRVPSTTKFIATPRQYGWSWTTPDSPLWEELISDKFTQDREYNLYGYSIEVKDPRNGKWMQLWELTDDIPLLQYDCPEEPWFVNGGVDNQSAIGLDQTIIRGHDKIEYRAGSDMIIQFTDDRLRTPDWYYYLPKSHPLKHFLEDPWAAPPEYVSQIERTPDYQFRIRAIYRCYREIDVALGEVQPDGTRPRTYRTEEFILYTKPSNVSTSYGTKTSFDKMGYIYREKSRNFIKSDEIFNDEPTQPTINMPEG